MKSFALAALAFVASAVELDGYTIDLCPDPFSADSLGEAVYLPGNEEILALTSAWTKTGAPLYSFDQLAYQQRAFDQLSASQKLNQLAQMRNIQNLYRLGMATEVERLNPVTAMQLASALTDNVEFIPTSQQEFVVTGSTTDELEKLAFINALASQQRNIGIVGQNVIDFQPGMVQETFPGAVEAVQQRLAMIPGADMPGNIMTPGISYSPDSFSLAAQNEYLGCVGQPVLVYPERESNVLFCGERNLQGNQTLKRTNIHHNYVHDIHHQHNYHNRTKHAAKQFNSVEKDCSCKGTAVEAEYSCPPGIEAPSVAALPIGVSVYAREQLGSQGVDCICK